MFDYSVLNVFIGLVFIFLLYSLFASALQETLATFVQRRANTLYKGIRTMLSDTPVRSLPFWAVIFEQLGVFWLYRQVKKILKKTSNFNTALKNKILQRQVYSIKEKDTSIIRLYTLIYEHPIIKNYGQNDYFNRPSYLSDKNFSNVIVDVLKNLDAENKTRTATFALVRNSLEKYKGKIDTEVYDILNHHFNEAAGDLDAFKYRLEKWYNDSMNRVTGWYKRSTSFILFGIGIFLAFTLNIDTIEITTYLSANKPAAEKLANISAAAVSKGSDSLTKEIIADIKKEKDSVNTLLGLGWGDVGRKDTGFINKLKNNCPGKIKRGVNWLSHGIGFELFPAESVCHQMKSATDSIPPIVMEQHATYITWKYIWYKTTPKKFFGFFITAMAITMGAPFWFDLLGKLVSLRNAGKAILPGTTSDNKTDAQSELDG